MSLGALPGFRDFYPNELAERSFLFATWRAVAHRYGFVEYDGPPLEPLELYTRKSGEEIVGQLYNFIDKGEREVALRPEMTPTLARMAAARANALRKPVRWYSIPQLFRYERKQRGRLREHFQLNVDIIGEADVTADAELLAVAIDIMRAFGLTPGDVVARVSDRRILHDYLLAVGAPEASLEATFAVIDKLERQPREISAEKLAAAGLSEAARERVLAIPSTGLDDVRSALAGRPAEHTLRDLERYFDYLRALLGEDARDWLRFDLSIVRGLAYYTGIVFELFDAKGQFRAICGGGRYDNLLQSLSGVDLPALGFGMGDVVLGELLRERGLMRPPTTQLDFWVAGEDGEPTPVVMRVAAALRNAGASVEYALRPQSLDKQRKAARAAGARRIVIVPEGFEATGQVYVQWADPADAQAQGGGARGFLRPFDAFVSVWREHVASDIPEPIHR